VPLDPTPVPDELRGLRIALLISGGVAAYKMVDLASALTQAGCQVRVAMTASATRFVGPPTFEGVTGQSVQTGLFGGGPSPEPHVALGDWAQVILVAPATANLIGKIAGGRSDDIVTATLLAARCPVVLAPAMNDAMWAKAAVQENLATLRRRGVTVVEPEAGHLASGHTGTGRLAGAQSIFNALVHAVRFEQDESRPWPARVATAPAERDGARLRDARGGLSVDVEHGRRRRYSRARAAGIRGVGPGPVRGWHDAG
jgi:phosphopantothenoylcysteine synthetase/decarboxylase